MPFVNVTTARGLLNAEEKRALQTRITDLLVEIEGKGNPAFRPFVWVLIEEREPEDWCLGGTPVTGELIGRLIGGPEEAATGT